MGIVVALPVALSLLAIECLSSTALVMCCVGYRPWIASLHFCMFVNRGRGELELLQHVSKLREDLARMLRADCRSEEPVPPRTWAMLKGLVHI